LELLDLLSHGPKSVERLANATGMSVANVSQHLQTLFEARLVRFTRKGNYAIYELAEPSVAAFLAALRHLGERQLAEVGRIKAELASAFGSAEPIGMEELADRLASGEIVLIDVRPQDEYEKGHIPGAVSIPVEELERRLAELPKDKEIAAYCRGPYCLLAAQAAEYLQGRGFRARRLEEGVLEWRQFAASAR